jgi:hypothetical protein
MLDKQGVANMIRAQFGKHARVDKIEQTSSAKCLHEMGETRKRSEEKKRLEGEFGSYGKRARMKHSIRTDRFEEPDEFSLVPATDESGKKLVCRVCVSPGGNFREVRWVRRSAKAVFPKETRGGRSDSTPILDITKEKPDASEIPPYPEVYYRNSFASTVAKAKQLRASFSRRALGGMEILNENIGSQMVQHADPALKRELMDRGVIQVRKDQNGNAQPYMVAGSRKQQANILKEYNRRQGEAEARGWRGTRSSAGMGVKYIRHGGQTPD